MGLYRILYRFDLVRTAVRPARPDVIVSRDGRWDWNSSLLIRSDSVRLKELKEKQIECYLQMLYKVNGLGIVTRRVRVDSRSLG